MVVYITAGTPMSLIERGQLSGEPGSLEEAVDNLAAHLAENPDELEGWVLLGRSRKSQERFQEAELAFAQANRLAPDDPDILVEFAEARVLASPDRRMEGEPLEMILAALERDPTQQRGLLLLGIHHQQAGRRPKPRKRGSACSSRSAPMPPLRWSAASTTPGPRPAWRHWPVAQ
ncbi:tetratricopeptide repeat protein [Alkalisalibacterium limincola]|uniref:Cytochrome c-type biogenesis protein H TPR domain-containing protein n=1 Tax=Alkalisalibacterium limincola TaxID=2699169 RepID=A0A5C8KY80_9GAMM|nr:hypothetical protein [Alkalisalibacterium limincola]TXK65767.1 hypothetical protein FU658_01240 [Alkalisalibacterium limincola]